MRYMLFFSLFVFFNPSIKAEEIESILKIKPEIKYDENLKYEEINKYKENQDLSEKYSNYNFGFDIDINKELRTIESIKIDIGTNF